MSRKSKIAMIILAATVAATAAGCIPSDAEIAGEMDATRRAAYLEWKAQRDRGDTREVKVDGPLALADAVKLALQYNKPLQTWIQERDVTRGDRISAYSVILPTLDVTGGATRVENGRGNNDIDRYSAGVKVTQPIFNGEYIPARLRTARLNTALTDEKIREQVQLLISDIAGTYYDALLGRHMVEVHREALTSAEAQFRMVSEKKKQETATEYDVLRAQVDVATYRARMISAQNSVDTNRVALLKYMGVSQDSDISFSDELVFLPMRPVFERAVEIASGHRPDVRMAELDARIANEAVRIAQSEFWPSLNATFTQNWQDGWGNTFNNRDAFGRNPWQAGLGLSYTFGIDNVGGLRSARARARQRQIDILDRQEAALMEIRMYMNSLVNAEEMVKALEVNQDAAREALRLVLVGYQAGVKTEVDVTDARKALTDVMGQYYESLTDHTKARLNLQVAMGVLGPSLITDCAPLPPRVPIANIEEFAATDYVPPTPITMPTASDIRPTSRTAPPVVPAPQPEFRAPAPALAPAQIPAPRAAPEQAPTPQPRPAQAAIEERIVSTPLASVADLPPPPVDAPPAARPVTQPAPDRTVAAPPVVAARPEPEVPAERPLFRIRVREGASELPAMADAGQ